MLLLLEFARGVAALWVVIFHLQTYFEALAPPIHRLAELGYLGVPMFFVISGYVITHSAEANLRRNASPLEFLKNRFLRIYPAYWASILVAITMPYLLEALSYLKSGAYNHPDSVFAGFSFSDWANLLILTKVFYAQTFDLYLEFKPINAVYWSLAIEFQFYLVVFLALYLKRFYRAFIAVVSVATIVVMYLPQTLNHGLFIHFWPAFSVGILLAYLHKSGVYFKATSALNACVSILLFAGSVYALDAILPLHFNKLPFVFAYGFGGVLWFIAGAEKDLQAIKAGHHLLPHWGLQPWLNLGAMSYSVYLLHLEVFPLCEMLLRQVTANHGAISGIIIIAATVLVCYPFYFYVERRFLSKNYQRMHQKIVGH